MATAALIVGTVASAASIVQGFRAAKEQREQNEIRNRIAATARMRNVRRAIAESRVRRAQVQASGFELGVSGGTAVSGAEFGITGDLASSIAQSQQQFTGQQVIAQSQNRVSQLQQSAATFGGISNLAGQFDEQAVAAISNLVRG